jgi:E3 ubiquitin-protein ligase HUWE1
LGRATSLPPVALHVLPLVEAFFVLCECLQRKIDQEAVVAERERSAAAETMETAADASAGASTATTSTAPEPGRGMSLTLSSSQLSVALSQSQFVRFAERHRKLLNAYLRQSPARFEGSLALMLKVPRLIEFENKRAYFKSQIQQEHAERTHNHTIRICVRRPPHLLEDSFRQLHRRSAEELKGRLTVQFQGEEGIDAGGVTREWYTVLSREMFNVENALWATAANNNATFQPNPNSTVHDQHLMYFKFVGRVVGKALYDGQLLDVNFTRSFYKHILGVPITYEVRSRPARETLSTRDPQYYTRVHD